VRRSAGDLLMIFELCFRVIFPTKILFIEVKGNDA
jgi:hypothetical protein